MVEGYGMGGDGLLENNIAFVVEELEDGGLQLSNGGGEVDGDGAIVFFFGEGGDKGEGVVGTVVDVVAGVAGDVYFVAFALTKRRGGDDKSRGAAGVEKSFGVGEGAVGKEEEGDRVEGGLANGGGELHLDGVELRVR